METIILKSKSKTNLKLKSEIARKMGVTVVKGESNIMEEIGKSLLEVKEMKEGRMPKKTLKSLLTGE